MGKKLKVEMASKTWHKGGGFYLYFEGKYNSCWCRTYPDRKNKNLDLSIFTITNTTVFVNTLQKGYIFYFPSNNSTIEKNSYQCKSFLSQQGFSFEGFPFPDSLGWPTEKPKKEPDVRPSSSKTTEQKPQTCKYCGKKGLSPRATMCPNCGEPLRNI